MVRSLAGPARAAASAAALSVVLAATSLSHAREAAARRPETPAAREQARLCERLDGEEAIAACRQALALGLGDARGRAVRELLSRRLAAAERWDELVAALQDSLDLVPEDAVAWSRLGSVLLFAAGRAGEAVPALEHAVRLAPEDAAARCDLAVALASVGRLADATEAFDAAARLDPGVLGSRPAARAVRDAAREGRRWP